MMFWDITAMVFAGFLFAGLAMPIKFFFKKTPKWFVPTMAGVGMISYQILSEYTWYSTTTSNLPDGSVVVATVPSSTWFRPWSYVKPNVFQFMVLDTKNTVKVADNITQARLYFFERRMPAHELPVLFDCQNGLQAMTPTAKSDGLDLQNLDWQKLEYTDKAIRAICP